MEVVGVLASIDQEVVALDAVPLDLLDAANLAGPSVVEIVAATVVPVPAVPAAAFVADVVVSLHQLSVEFVDFEYFVQYLRPTLFLGGHLAISRTQGKKKNIIRSALLMATFKFIYV